MKRRLLTLGLALTLALPLQGLAQDGPPAPPPTVKKLDQVAEREKAVKAEVTKDRLGRQDLKSLDEAKKAIDALKEKQEKLKNGEDAGKAQEELAQALQQAVEKVAELEKRQKDA